MRIYIGLFLLVGQVLLGAMSDASDATIPMTVSARAGKESSKIVEDLADYQSIYCNLVVVQGCNEGSAPVTVSLQEQENQVCSVQQNLTLDSTLKVFAQRGGDLHMRISPFALHFIGKRMTPSQMHLHILTLFPHTIRRFVDGSDPRQMVTVLVGNTFEGIETDCSEYSPKTSPPHEIRLVKDDHHRQECV